MKRRSPHPLLLLLATLGLVAAACGSPGQAAGPGDERSLILATTTSTQDSGLLEELLPAFTADTGWQVKPIAVGTGQALELGRRGEVDVLLVHAPPAEKKLVATGTTGRRLLVMHNDFVLVGPATDPAGIRDEAAADALGGIAGARQLFVSRGDDSGTEKKELALWEQAGISPSGGWYQSTGQGMAATLRVASEKRGYTLTDRATFLALRDTLDLEVLVEGDPGLLNPYHVIEMTTAAGDSVREEGAAAFADWLVSARAQKIIAGFGVREYGRPLFVPDAGKSVSELTS
ncbi:MAG: tungsten ABC transporter substrate-binding protein [Pseudonocardiaceae bacterium]|nr:tungsten ABC transporter substrate-binding protein [Pseudonocardiaceae bacterium]